MLAPPEGWLGIAYVTVSIRREEQSLFKREVGSYRDDLQVRPDAPADGGEGFKRTWSEAKEEVSVILTVLSEKCSYIFLTGRVDRRWAGQWEARRGEFCSIIHFFLKEVSVRLLVKQ